ncbi:glycosyltransferase family 1 protein [uncultured Erythrobacter sp.]|uniref:glycosyltransferase family 4 protein n=1 Tax=uncultured Erythrobacter sp. TaxID=263913 RepID=UPI00261DC384|nr:glycosyltransferase family 1 protein [uncultured Erythrobacter sp.]
MRDTVRPVLLDVTRLIGRSWTGRRSTGIDRVCYAYLKHFRHRALAVVQLRGVIRVLDHELSERLFGMLLAPSAGFRGKFARLTPRLIAGRKPAVELSGLTYLNVSHTDFDLKAHWDWIANNGLRSAVFIHDLIPIRDPDLSRPIATNRNRKRARAALQQADRIIVSSHHVADDLRRFAAEQGLTLAALVISPIAGETFQAELCPPAKPHFLCVGTIEPRKNHALLFDIWRELAAKMGAKTPKLVVVGQKGPMTGKLLAPMRAPEIAPYVELHDSCTDQELAELMRNASALLFPSLSEGFGLPLVEALQMGTPVIASDTPIFREIGQGMPLLLGPTDKQAWIEAVAAHAKTPVSMADRAARAARFDAPDWDSHFEAVELAIAPSRLKTRGACETSLAA